MWRSRGELRQELKSGVEGILVASSAQVQHALMGSWPFRYALYTVVGLVPITSLAQHRC